MDKEARLIGTTPAEHPQALRLWLRMLTCTQLIETQVRTQLREQFDTTLPRFDLMAQLERAPEGLKMNELSRRMMVTGGNVTAITDQIGAGPGGASTSRGMAASSRTAACAAVCTVRGSVPDAGSGLLTRALP